MKDHFEKSHKAEETEEPTTSRQTKMENFVVKTSGTDKKKFDIAIARFFYGSNIPFRAADSTEFKRWLISWLETPKFKIYRGATA